MITLPRGMRDRKARSFVAIMIVIAVSALVLRFATEKIIKINIAQNESNAQANLKLISTALENYARDHQGLFPVDLSVLLKTKPPYVDKNYVEESPAKGYSYNCSRLEPSGYRCTASPSKCGLTGTVTYSVTTGEVFESQGCSKEE